MHFRLRLTQLAIGLLSSIRVLPRRTMKHNKIYILSEPAVHMNINTCNNFKWSPAGGFCGNEEDQSREDGSWMFSESSESIPNYWFLNITTSPLPSWGHSWLISTAKSCDLPINSLCCCRSTVVAFRLHCLPALRPRLWARKSATSIPRYWKPPLVSR